MRSLFLRPRHEEPHGRPRRGVTSTRTRLLASACFAAAGPLLLWSTKESKGLTSSPDGAHPGPLALAEAADEAFPPTAPAAYAWWVLIVYMFYVMSAVCDDYLVPTVDVICEKYGIPEDVAGATLVAFACNGPELLTNVDAIFIAHSKVGMGTVVGSAIFNVMCIVGACPWASPGGILRIPWKTFLRDAFFSVISILILLWCLPVFDMLRANVLFGMSAVYVFVVAKSEAWFGVSTTKNGGLDGNLLDAEADYHKGLEEKPFQREISARVEECEAQESGIRKYLLGFVFFPISFTNFVLWLTIPDVQKPEKRKLYVVSFFVSMTWLASTAFIVCQGADQIQVYWHIPASFTGLTLVSIGTSWPNLWASVVTARRGCGDMAVSNALGSNVQNVFFVLAFPIWIQVLLNGSYTMVGGDISLSVGWMLFTVLFVVAVSALSGFVLGVNGGKAMVLVYLAYLANAAWLDWQHPENA